MPTPLASWDDFQKIEFRVGTIVAVEPFPEARKPALKLQIDLGEPLGLKWSSAQITQLYEPQSLIGRQIVAAVNLGRKQIGPFVSEVLVTGFPDENGNVVLTQPERKVPNGARLF